MSSKTFYAVAAFAAFAALASTAARADDITIDTTPFHSQRSRAEVQGELMQYKQTGVNPWADDYNQLAQFRSTVTREQVRAEYLADRNEVAAMTREDSGSAYLAQLAAAAKSGADGTKLAATPGHAH